MVAIILFLPVGISIISITFTTESSVQSSFSLLLLPCATENLAPGGLSLRPFWSWLGVFSYPGRYLDDSLIRLFLGDSLMRISGSFLLVDFFFLIIWCWLQYGWIELLNLHWVSYMELWSLSLTLHHLAPACRLA